MTASVLPSDGVLPRLNVGGWLWVMTFGLAFGALVGTGILLLGFGGDREGLRQNPLALGLLLAVLAQATLVWLLLSRSPYFPRLAIVWFAAGWPAIGLMSAAGGVVDGRFYLDATIQWALCAIVWIPYLLVSKRVAATFKPFLVAPPPNTDRRVSESSTLSSAPIAQMSPERHPSPPQAVQLAAVTPEIQGSTCESCWEGAFLEMSGPGRRNGVWAKYFAETDGDETLTAARYLGDRSQALHADHVVRFRESQRAAETAELARLELEAQRAAGVRAAMPKGLCPNCGADVVLDDPECGKCHASFDQWSAWKPTPIPS